MREQPQVTVIVNGQTYPAIRMDVVSSNEPWQEILLADGSVIRKRDILVGVYFVPALSVPGRPHYTMEFTSIFNTTPGPALQSLEAG